MDLAIINTWLVTLQKGLVIKDGCLTVEDNTITFVGKTAESDYKSADIIIDGSHHIYNSFYRKFQDVRIYYTHIAELNCYGWDPSAHSFNIRVF